MSPARRTHDAVSITGARRSLSEDVSARTRRYLLIMLVRTAAFVLAVVLTGGWLRWVCIVLAVVLPYIAVVIANGGRENAVASPTPYTPNPLPALGTGPSGKLPGPRDAR